MSYLEIKIEAEMKKFIDISYEILKLGEKYVKYSGKNKNLIKSLLKKRIEKEIVKKFSELYGVTSENIHLLDNEFEYKVGEIYTNKDEKIKVGINLYFKFKKENDKIKLVGIKLEKTITKIS